VNSARIRNVIKDDFGGKLPSGRPFHPDVRWNPRLSRGPVFTVRRRSKNCIRADAVRRQRGHGRIRADVKKYIFYFYFYFYFFIYFYFYF
jgi:hypothetical protein